MLNRLSTSLRSPARIAVACVALAALSMGSVAQADDYPSRPIKLVSPYSAGGGNDIAGRIMAEVLTPKLGQQIVVENKVGAVGIIGTESVARSAPDGYTLLWATGDNLSIVPALKKNLPYKIPDDFTYIARVAENGLAYVISSKVPAKNMQEFVAYAKANPGKLRFGSAGFGGVPHMSVELFMKATGVQMQHIPYKGIANAMVDVLSGEIDFAPVTPVSISPYLNSDRVRIIGFAGPQRHPVIPNVPTMRELGYPDSTVTVWYGLLGPAKLPKPIADRLRTEVTAVLADPAVVARLEKAGLTVAPVYGDGFQKVVIDELAQWREVARTQNIVME